MNILSQGKDVAIKSWYKLLSTEEYQGTREQVLAAQKQESGLQSLVPVAQVLPTVCARQDFLL